MSRCVTCGHERRDHIYEEGACRPGFICEKACKRYLAPWTEVHRASDLSPSPKSGEA